VLAAAGSRLGPSPSWSSVSLLPVARTGSYDVRVGSRTRGHFGQEGVVETSRMVVDHLKVACVRACVRAVL
jgi:hypothetical protein